MVSNLTLLFRDKLQLIENTEAAENRSNEKIPDSSGTAKNRCKKGSDSDSSRIKTRINVDTKNLVFTDRNFFFSSPSISSSSFAMPLHYPTYKRHDYEDMSEDVLDRLLDIYGLPILGDLVDKKAFAVGAFLWEDNNVEEQPSSPAEDCVVNPNSTVDDSDQKSTWVLMEFVREMVRYMFRV